MVRVVTVVNAVSSSGSSRVVEGTTDVGTPFPSLRVDCMEEASSLELVKLDVDVVAELSKSVATSDAVNDSESVVADGIADSVALTDDESVLNPLSLEDAEESGRVMEAVASAVLSQNVC